MLTVQKIINPLGRRLSQLPESTYSLGYRIFGGKVNQKIFFLHLAKCGGTSIDHALRNSFGVSEYLLGKGSFHLNPRASHKEMQTRDYRKQLLLEKMSNKRIKYISGHFSYSEAAYQKFGHEWNFITVLRNPVERWFSLYFFNRYKGSDHNKWEMDLETYIQSEKGISSGCSYIGALTESKVTSLDRDLDRATAQAIDNLEKFALVGVIEKLDLFMRDFKDKFGVQLLIPEFNKNPLSQSKQEEKMTDEIYEQVVALCQPNIRVYEAALKRIGAPKTDWTNNSDRP